MSINDIQAGSTPLASRGNPIIYLVVIIAIAFIVIALGIWFGLNFLKKYKKSEKYISRQSNKPTEFKDIKIFAQKHLLSPEMKAMLWKICKRFNIPNIIYSVNDFNQINNYFREYYEEVKAQLDQKELDTFFTLLFKIERICANSTLLKSSHGIPLKTIFTHIHKAGNKLSFKLIENTDDFMVLEPSDSFYELPERPEPLSKIIFSFTSETKMQYGFVSRIVRYQKAENEKVLLVISHPAELFTQQNRKNKRLFLQKSITFTSCTRDEQQKYIPGEKRFNGTLSNISASGCCIVSNLPIRTGQLLIPDLSDFEISETIIGTIRHTRNTLKEGIYNLHIQFEKISLESKNKIQALVFNYETFE